MNKKELQEQLTVLRFERPDADDTREAEGAWLPSAAPPSPGGPGAGCAVEAMACSSSGCESSEMEERRRATAAVVRG